MPTADTFCMNLHLAEISQSVAEDVQIALVLDGAGWHKSKSLHVPDNITLVPLPPYSPELNPIELAWLYMKSHYLANRVYENHEALYEAGIDAWNRFTADRALVRSVCRVTWTESAQLN
jgi:transposase